MNTLCLPAKKRVRTRISGPPAAYPDIVFDDIYILYEAAIFRYCYWKCRDRETGQDLAQMTFLRFWLCLQREERILHVRAFLYRIAHNLVIDHIRRKKEDSLDALLETGFEPAVDLWHETYSRLDAKRVLQKIDTMQPSYKRVLHDHFLHGFTSAEIALTLEETTNAISVRLCRGLKYLRLLLEDAAPPIQDGPVLQGTYTNDNVSNVFAIA